ncbi:SDR family oxidoreductase [Sphingobium sp. JS3065]|uniref:SDR family NAD(P)-dependent oxidoreductase n=1 Tax=Sphingobium sp. JS3065 TaxID=2970925 RepID=UPI0022643639|nr:SDR family oxidoreductase [Sphingobium sp. JS3065]UZW56428.1 SDR family oxidoreductase [Sphingobium sp. JS3065]
MSTSNLMGTVSLVTGALGGIGRATARVLIDAGSTVLATDLVAESDEFGSGNYRRLNITDQQDWQAVIADIEARHGRLDNLIHCAGVEHVASIASTSVDDFRRCMDVNVAGSFLALQSSQDLLARSGKLRKGGASVVLLSSVGGIRGGLNQAAYCASKGAVRLLAKSAAVEYGITGIPIRVNSVHPGCIETGMMDRIYEKMVQDGLFPDIVSARNLYSSRHPVGRMGKADEVATAILLLCSEASSFMTGSEMVIDGGLTA